MRLGGVRLGGPWPEWKRLRERRGSDLSSRKLTREGGRDKGVSSRGKPSGAARKLDIKRNFVVENDGGGRGL